MLYAEFKNETEAFQSFKLGKPEGFIFFYNKYKLALYSYALQILKGTNDEAQDVVIIAFNKLDEQKHTIFSPIHLRNFLYTMTRNNCYSIRHRNTIKVKAEKGLSWISSTIENDEDLDRQRVIAEMTRILPEIIRKLPIPTQRILKEYFEGGKTVTEIAKILNRDFNKVYREKNDALGRLRKAFVKRGYTNSPVSAIVSLVCLYLLIASILSMLYANML